MNKIKMIYMGGGGGIGMISMWSLWELDFELPGNHKRVCYNIGKLRALCYAINTREREREIERDRDVTNVFMQILTIYLCKIQKHEVFV